MKLWGSSSSALVLSLGLCLTVVRASPLRTETDGTTVCNSQECIDTANAILSDMNPNVDPCTDFYEYACGGFIEKTTIPEGKSQIGSFTSVRLRNANLLHSILTSPTEKLLELDSSAEEIDAARRNIAKIQSLFGSCMDEDSLVKVGRKPLFDQVGRLVEIMPVQNSHLLPAFSAGTLGQETSPPNKRKRNDANKQQAEETGGDVSHSSHQKQDDGLPSAMVSATAVDRATLARTLAFLESINVDTFVEVSIGSDPTDPTINGVAISEGGLGLPARQYYQDKKIMAAYHQLIQTMFSTILAPDTGATDATSGTVNAVQIADSIVQFELKLAGIATEAQDLRSAKLRNNPRTLQQLAELNPAIDWEALLEQILGPGKMSGKQVTVTSLPFQTNLAQLLAQTEASTLQNYFAWNMILEMAGYLSAELRKPLDEFDVMMKGIPLDQLPKRWETCVSAVSDTLASMVGHYYVALHFPGSSKNQSQAIVAALRERYVEGMPGLAWLDEPTRQQAIKKLDAMLQKVGFSTESPNIASSQSLDEHYAGLEMDANDYFGNRLRARVWGTNRTNSRAGEPVDRAEWHMSPQTVNAYYNRGVNEIVFPAGILQPPFFSSANPDYLNFGGIGAVAGHELTHGFDNNGRLYDANGAYANWWTDETISLFEQRAQCFVEQYSNFTVPNLDGGEEHVNGELTLGENLADNGGLKKSFEAWQRRLDHNSVANGGELAGEQEPIVEVNNQLLAGLEAFTREQLFFISYARLWCSKAVPQYELKKVRTDPHSPNRWRVVGAVQNSKPFAEAFKCGEGTPMNPRDKCEIW